MYLEIFACKVIIVYQTFKQHVWSTNFDDKETKIKNHKHLHHEILKFGQRNDELPS